MTRVFRQGAVGALMDEYERAGAEFARLISGISDGDFLLLRDARTEDEHCRSIQTIASHVVHSGFGYANSIRSVLTLPRHDHHYALLDHSEVPAELDRMLAFTAATLEGRWHYTDEQIMAVRIQARWGPVYDLEQLLEHAIVHILRHRRQCERFLSAAASA